MTIRSIFWFDPGVATGVAWCTVDLKQPTVAEALRNRTNSGSATIPKTTPSGTTLEDLHDTSSALWSYWARFKRQAVEQFLLDPDWIILGAENFILTPSPHHAPGVEGIWPAYVIGAFEGYRRGLFDSHHPKRARHITPLVLQPASKGMRFNNKQHLTNWDAWIKGKQHERAAFAHIGAYLMDLWSKYPRYKLTPGLSEKALLNP